MLYKTNYNSPIGKITLASNEKSLVGLWIENQKYFESTIDKEVIEKEDLEIFEQTKSWLDKYFNKEKPSISDLSLEPLGNEFRQRVWKLLCKIPYGEVQTYSEIAKEIAKQQGLTTMSAQAIGGAIGHNPISIIIPCHRVIGKNGSLTGYAGGLEIKKQLLTLEGAII